MPQMAPLMWSNILFSTFMIIIMLMVYNYFFKKVNFSSKEARDLLTTGKKWLW